MAKRKETPGTEPIRPALRAAPADKRHTTKRLPFVFIASVIATVPLISAVVRRVAARWEPSSDNASIARLVHDVLSLHTPLLGMPSTVGVGTTSSSAHHWGPLLFWVFAVPDRLSGSSPLALLITLAAFNVAALVAMVVFVRRRVGDGAAVTFLILVALAMSSIGQEVLSSIWNADIVILPVALFFVLVWSVACGDVVALPLGAFVGSFVVQSHLLYTPLVAILMVWAVIAFVLFERARRSTVDLSEAMRRGIAVKRALMASALVLAVVWMTAIYEQIMYWPGNVGQVFQSVTNNNQENLGYRTAVNFVERVVAIVPFWTHPVHSDLQYGRLFQQQSFLVHLVAFLVIAGLVATLIASWHRDFVTRALVGTALVALAATVITVASLPIQSFHPNPYRVRFAWVVGPFIWFTLGVATSRLVVVSAPRRVTAAVLAGVTALLAVAVGIAAAAHSPGFVVALEPDGFLGPTIEARAVRVLSAQVRHRLPRGETYVLGGDYFGVGTGVMWNLVRHGYDVRLPSTDPYLGDKHPAPRDRMARPIVTALRSDYTPGPDGQLLASFTNQRASDRRHERRLCAALREYPPSVLPLGRAALDGFRRHKPDPVSKLLGVGMERVIAEIDNGSPPCSILNDSTLVAMVGRKWVSVKGFTAADLSRLQAAARDFVVYLGPPRRF